jgi:hypothetical protein
VQHPQPLAILPEQTELVLLATEPEQPILFYAVSLPIHCPQSLKSMAVLRVDLAHKHPKTLCVQHLLLHLQPAAQAKMCNQMKQMRHHRVDYALTPTLAD